MRGKPLNSIDDDDSNQKFIVSNDFKYFESSNKTSSFWFGPNDRNLKKFYIISLNKWLILLSREQNLATNTSGKLNENNNLTFQYLRMSDWLYGLFWDSLFIWARQL